MGMHSLEFNNEEKTNGQDSAITGSSVFKCYTSPE